MSYSNTFSAPTLSHRSKSPLNEKEDGNIRTSCAFFPTTCFSALNSIRNGKLGKLGSLTARADFEILNLFFRFD